MPKVGIDELVAALHHRREGRQLAADEMRAALAHLSDAIERHRARIAELRAAERSLDDESSAAARGDGG